MDDKNLYGKFADVNKRSSTYMHGSIESEQLM